MNCEQALEIIYFGTPEQKDSKPLHDHLDECPSCAVEAEPEDLSWVDELFGIKKSTIPTPD